MTLSTRFADALGHILDGFETEGVIPRALPRRRISIEPPHARHGDLSINAAMVLAAASGGDPRALAALLAPKLAAIDGVVAVEIVEMGFINLRLARDVWHDELATILARGDDYGRSAAGANDRVDIVSVAGDPGGSTWWGHCRAALYGDALGRLLAFVGHPVSCEHHGGADLGADLALIGITGDRVTADAAGRGAAMVTIAASGRPPEIKTVGDVRLFERGKPIALQRSIGVADIVHAVGRDVARFAMLSGDARMPMDYDIVGVAEASKHNPAFSVAYAHSRVRSAQRRACASGHRREGRPDFARLDDDALGLAKLASRFPGLVEQAASLREPHRVALYLHGLTTAFNRLWDRDIYGQNRRFLVQDDPDTTHARLSLAEAIGQIVRNGLAIMGVAAAEEI